MRLRTNLAIALLVLVTATPATAVHQGQRRMQGASPKRSAAGMRGSAPFRPVSHVRQGRAIGRSAHVQSGYRNWNHPQGLYASWPSFYPTGWSDYGFGYYSPYSYHAQPYTHSPYFPYLYFYDQYAREADESRRAADEFEASLAREGKLTGPAKAGSFVSDWRPPLPRDVALTFDGEVLTPSPSGHPVVIGSGQHALRISSKTASGEAPQPTN